MNHLSFKSAARPKSPPTPTVNPFWRQPKPVERDVIVLTPELPTVENRKPTLQELMEAVILATGIAKHDICGPWRNVNIMRARFIFVYLARRYTEATFPQIGKVLKRDHSTIIHAYQRVCESRDEYCPELDYIIHKMKLA